MLAPEESKEQTSVIMLDVVYTDCSIKAPMVSVVMLSAVTLFHLAEKPSFGIIHASESKLERMASSAHLVLTNIWGGDL